VKSSACPSAATLRKSVGELGRNFPRKILSYFIVVCGLAWRACAWAARTSPLLVSSAARDARVPQAVGTRSDARQVSKGFGPLGKAHDRLGDGPA